MYKKIRTKYVDLTGLVALNNEFLNRPMFLSGCGCAMHKQGLKIQRGLNQIDTRIHILPIQPSGTGKKLAIDLMKTFVDSLGQDIDFTAEASITDAGLVGSIDDKIDQMNKQKDLYPGMPEYKHPVIYGDLALKDIIAFEEAQQMFRQGAHNESILNYLQIAMDSGNWLEKKMRVQTRIAYHSDATIVGTTYFLDEFKEIVIQQGIFRRFLVTVKNLTMKEKRDMVKMMIRGPETKYDPEDVAIGLRHLGEDVGEAIQSYEPDTVFKMDESGIRFLEGQNDQLFNYLETDFIGKEATNIQPFTGAIVDFYVKLGSVAAVLNGSNIIRAKELKSVQPEIDLYFNSIANELLPRTSSRESEKLQKSIYSLLVDKDKHELPVDMLRELILAGKDRVEPRQFSLAVGIMKQNNELIQTKNKDGKKMLKLNR
jgi:hypothetical protein